MGQASNQRKQNSALALLALLCLVLSVFAWRQEPQRDPYIEPARWDDRDYWLQPVERNPHLRLQSVQATLISVATLENGDLIAVGSSGAVVRSLDQGAHWQAISSNTRVDLWSVISLPKGRLIAVGDNGTLLHSPDHGHTWQRQVIGKEDLRAISIIEHSSGLLLLAVGNKGTVLRSTDQGIHWQEISNTTSRNLYAVSAIGNGHIAAAGSGGTFLLSDDGGLTWQKQKTESIASFYAINPLPSGNILLGGNGHVILRSSDQGKTWQTSSKVTTKIFRPMLNLPNGHIVALGDPSTVLLSTDQGQTWEIKFSGQKITNGAIFKSPKGDVVAIGEGGTRLQSTDQGKTWQIRSNTSVYFTNKQFYFPNGRIIASGANDYVRISTDRGQTWHVRKIAEDIGNIANFIGFADGRTFALTKNGMVLLSIDQGDNWQVVSKKGPTDLDSAIILPNEHILVTAWPGKTELSTDQGVTWQTLDTQGSTALANLTNRRIIRTKYRRFEISLDEGKTWLAKDSGTAELFFDITSSASGRVLAVGTAGNIILSTDQGDTWRSKNSGSKEVLRAVRSLSNGHFITVGDAGTLLISTDQGETWQSKTTNTKAELNAITNLDDGRILVSATNGEVLFSDDQGETWQAITYRRYPARWYWCALALMLFPTVWLLRRKPALLPTDGLNELQASDSPELDPSQDRLGHREIVQGVSAFMRNEDTRMPLTLAVTGAWGLGKSSLMGFLNKDLAAQGFRCVWFNPWHYQKEEHILAALLEQVQQCAVPPLLSPAGVGFRWRLLCKRLRQHLVKSVLLVTVAAAGMFAMQLQGDSLRDALGYIVNGPPAVKQLAPDDASAQASAKASASASAHSSVPAQASSSTPASAPAPTDTASKTTPAPRLDLLERTAKVLISTFFHGNQDQEAAANAFLARLLAMSLALLSALPLLFAASHAMRAFSVKASVLFTSIDGWLGVTRAKAQTSFRASFAAEFRQVTEALAPQRLAIFIDDLDRCKPEVVMEMMEAVNFLSVSGDCFIVLGIAPDKVAHAIGLAQKDIAGQLEPKLPRAQARLQYGNMYLRKLVNIEIPVGSLNPDKVRNLLLPPEPAAAPAVLTPEQTKRDKSMLFALNSLQALLGLLWRGGQAVLLFAVPVLLLWGVANLPQWKTPPAAAPIAPVQAVAAAPEPTPTPTPSHTPTPVPQNKIEKPEPPSEIYIRQSGDPTPPFAVSLAPLLVFLLLAVVALRAWLHGLQQRMQDTTDFKLACRIWTPVIALLLDSSREVKRWQNRVRYINARLRLITPPPSYWQRAKLASQQRREQFWLRALFASLLSSLRLPAPEVTQALHEAQLVALSALMSVANRFDFVPALQQAANHNQRLTDIAEIMAEKLRAQYLNDESQNIHHLDVGLAIEEAVKKTKEQNADSSTNSSANSGNTPITPAVMQQFFEIAQQFEIAEKPIVASSVRP